MARYKKIPRIKCLCIFLLHPMVLCAMRKRLSTALAGWQDLLAKPREARQSNATPTLHGPEQERARATLDVEVPVLFFDRFRRLQAKKEIILQHSLSLAMLARNGRWSETEVSHNFVVTYI